jgi:hypothetical protein
MHNLVFVYPAHFHAALSLREKQKNISNDVYVYAPEGPEIQQFLSIAKSFNERSIKPTEWDFHIYKGRDYLEKALDEKRGDVTILAGKNNIKMDIFSQLHFSGFHILCDKPWIIKSEQLKDLVRVTSSTSPVFMDLMTSRREIINMIRRRLMHNSKIFGNIFNRSDLPSVYLESVHHLYKIVNGRPLIRPSWFFDIDVQGEGIVDIPSHLVDLAHWTLFPLEDIDFEKDINLKKVKSWNTEVPLNAFQRITGLKKFPESLERYVKNDVLNFRCNAEFEYEVKDIHVKVKTIWNLGLPNPTEDTHYSIFRGTSSNLVVSNKSQKGARSGLIVEPTNKSKLICSEIEKELGKMGEEFKDISIIPENDNLVLDIPLGIQAGHEAHFSQVFTEFMKLVERGETTKRIASNILTKYRLLTAAREEAAIR